MNVEYVEQQRNKLVNNLKAKRVWGDIDEILQKFLVPTFLDIRITLRNPLLIVKGWLHFTEYF
jgi:hypothetical protein